MFAQCYHVRVVFARCSRNVRAVCMQCSRGVRTMFARCSRSVCQVFARCSRSVKAVFASCSHSLGTVTFPPGQFLFGMTDPAGQHKLKKKGNFTNTGLALVSGILLYQINVLGYILFVSTTIMALILGSSNVVDIPTNRK